MPFQRRIDAPPETIPGDSFILLEKIGEGGNGGDLDVALALVDLGGVRIFVGDGEKCPAGPRRSLRSTKWSKWLQERRYRVKY